MPLIDNAVYVDGHRAAEPQTLEETFETAQRLGGMAWIGLYRPSEEELRAVADEFGLHPLSVEDALAGHQRAKAEKYGDVSFVVLRPARYLDAEEKVEFGEVHVFVGPTFVVTVRHAESPDLGAVRRRMEENPELLALGPRAVLYGVLDQVVDEYGPVTSGLENDIDEIEDQLFGEGSAVSRRIYELSREVMAFQRAVTPIIGILDDIERAYAAHDVDIELRRNLGDVHDHAIRVAERADSFRVLLQNALVTNSTLAAEAQNNEMRRMTEASLAQGEQVKRISSYAAILFAPSLIGSVYGMNFDNMPELHWYFGYPIAIGLMLALSGGLYLVFKRKGWL
ncbi:magnesium and cobalt transport protein CorA [Amnibacterium flavum]|uniref:Transporter n=1 Tax=Amnibacterium flavum TaxID=2173173 RepID=A0A2V1HSC1_9MICO|nr:magnesium and cobalt transport protein CorA [Amnibacterium flavum]PVZ93939.1 transporter [Amnibacterium flavum]